MTALERDAMTLLLTITFRSAAAADLPKLEWYGQYTHFRNLFRKAYREQQFGRRYMLLADCGGFPIGTVFLQLASAEAEIERRAYMYSLRVMEMFRGQGIGTRLIQEAEAIMLDRDFRWATIAVAKDNDRARRLYERLDYHVYAEDRGDWSYIDHEGNLRQVREPCWLLEKSIFTR